MPTDDAALATLLAELPQKSTLDMYAELEAARRADAERPRTYTIIPEPVHPPMWPAPGSGIMKFPCGLGCGWAHDEDVYADGGDILAVPLGASSEEIGCLFAEHAEKRGATVRVRIETAVREHFADAHPGQEPPVREVW
ncbi:hypothetical protein [Streptomyces sp. NBC_00425]|uniref:hypothetical protein n=1 Tax=Streptomyces sp. NBC_00425 TaxID=2975740 RepID=UPI002E1CD17B